VDEAAVDGFGTEAAQEGDRCLVGGPELVVGGHAAGLEVVAVDLLEFSPPAERCARRGRGTIDGSSGIYDDRREGVRGSAAHADAGLLILPCLWRSAHFGYGSVGPNLRD